MSEYASQETLIHRFGLKFNPKFSCASNAVVNDARILLQNGKAKLFKVDNEPVHHAYVVCENVVLNAGVTTLTANLKYFPDYPLSFFKHFGEDRTKLWLEYTLEAFDTHYLPRHDFAGNRKHLEQVFQGEKLTKVIEYLRLELAHLL